MGIHRNTQLSNSVGKFPGYQILYAKGLRTRHTLQIQITISIIAYRRPLINVRQLWQPSSLDKFQNPFFKLQRVVCKMEVSILIQCSTAVRELTGKSENRNVVCSNPAGLLSSIYSLSGFPLQSRVSLIQSLYQVHLYLSSKIVKQ